MEFLQTLYSALIFHLLVNKSIKTSLNSIVTPNFEVYFTGADVSDLSIPSSAIEVLGESKDLKTKIRNLNSQLTSDNQACNIKSILIVNGLLDIPHVTESLYVFYYSSFKEYLAILRHYKSLLFNPLIPKIIITKHDLEIFKICISKQMPIKITITELSPRWARYLLIMTLLISIFFLYRLGLRIIKSISKLDPIYTDFSISSSSLLKFSDLTDKSVPSCTICFEDFKDSDDVRVLKCRHLYHPECIDRWLIGHSKSCPCCRNKIEIEEKAKS